MAHDILKRMIEDTGWQKTAGLIKEAAPSVSNICAWDPLRKAPDQLEGQRSGAGRPSPWSAELTSVISPGKIGSQVLTDET